MKAGKSSKSKLKERLEKIYRESPDIIIIKRFKNGKIAEVSDAVEKMLGYTPEEFIGRTKDWRRAQKSLRGAKFFQ